MIKRNKFSKLLGIAVAAAAVPALLFTVASPSYAASAPTVAVSGPHPQVAVRIGGNPVPGMTYTVTTRAPTRTQVISANVSCSYGEYTRVNGYILAQLVWWMAMNTNYCWNGSIVTWHSTTISHAVASGWYFSQGPTVFTCPNGCRENAEHNESSFGNKYGIDYVTINQEQYYNGNYTWNWHITAY
jgi:hypothetical protein